jgi:hypothetical protein
VILTRVQSESGRSWPFYQDGAKGRVQGNFPPTAPPPHQGESNRGHNGTHIPNSGRTKRASNGILYHHLGTLNPQGKRRDASNRGGISQQIPESTRKLVTSFRCRRTREVRCSGNGLRRFESQIELCAWREGRPCRTGKGGDMMNLVRCLRIPV